MEKSSSLSNKPAIAEEALVCRASHCEYCTLKGLEGVRRGSERELGASR